MVTKCQTYQVYTHNLGDSITAFELSTLSMMSDDSGQRVTIVYVKYWHEYTGPEIGFI